MTTTVPSVVVIPNTLEVAVGRPAVTVGGTLRVHGTGCVDLEGSSTDVDVEVFLEGSSTQPDRVGANRDGSFAVSLPIADRTPPGDQPVTAQCWGSRNATTTTSDGGPGGGPIGQGAASVMVTATSLIGVTPKRVAPSDTITVRGRCTVPGNTYERFAAWLAHTGEEFRFPPSSNDLPPATGYPPNGVTTTTHPDDGLPPGHAVATGGCTGSVATASISAPSGLAPGTCTTSGGPRRELVRR